MTATIDNCHANLTALMAALEDARKLIEQDGQDRYVHMGRMGHYSVTTRKPVGPHVTVTADGGASICA